MKKLDYYLNLNYPITIDKFTDYDGKIKYVTEIPDLPGCSSYAEELEEALKKLEDAKISWIEVSLARNLEIPEPVTENKFSGKFLLRIPAKLHKQLSVRASRESLSLNQFTRFALEKYLEHDLLALKIDSLEKLMKCFGQQILELSVTTELSAVVSTGVGQPQDPFVGFGWLKIMSNKASLSGKLVKKEKEEIGYTA
jgi:antitoxin HicB